MTDKQRDNWREYRRRYEVDGEESAHQWALGLTVAAVRFTDPLPAATPDEALLPPFVPWRGVTEV